MINDYLKNSRVQLNNTSIRKSMFANYYNNFNIYLKLAQSVHDDLEIPDVKITSSLNKLCEIFNFRNKNYIVYDQYLGQFMNKLNRLLLYETEDEAFFYLCKLLGEEYFILNNTKQASIFLLTHQIKSKSLAKNLSKKQIKDKNQMVTSQESFVFFHELSHLIVNKKNDYLDYSQNFITNSKGISFILDNVNNLIKEKSLPKSTLNNFLEEVSCDFLAANLSYTLHTKFHMFDRENYFYAITSAFLYLRTLYDIKFYTNKRDNDIFLVFLKLRYIVLRQYISDHYNATTEESKIMLDIYDKWEKKIDMNLYQLFDINKSDDFINKYEILEKLNNTNIAKEIIKKL